MTLRPEPYRQLERAEVFGALDTLADAARARGVEMASLALAWVLHHPRMDAAVIGPRRPSHIETALAALDIALSDEEAEQLSGLIAVAGSP